MKKLISHKAQLILTICADADEPLSAIYLSDEAISYSLERNRFGPVGNFLHRYSSVGLSLWLDLAMSPAFLTDSLDELVMSGRLVEQGKFPNQRYTITARGRRTIRVIQNWEARVKERELVKKAQTA